MTGLTLGSLFSGYAGLDIAIHEVLGGRTVWFSEHEPPTQKNPKPSQGAARILAHRFPDVLNLGDISAVDWPTVMRPTVLGGGFPCTDVSAAGGRAGLMDGTRSGLWAEFATAIHHLRPRLVVIENVRGLLSAKAGRGDAEDPALDPLIAQLLEDDDDETDTDPAGGDLGSEDEDLGDGDEPGPVLLRALGAVLGDLADLGYDAVWCGLRAADVGAPHGRFRVFILAWPAADADHTGRSEHGRPITAPTEHAPTERRSPLSSPDTDGPSWGFVQPGGVTPGPAEGTLLEAGWGARRDRRSCSAPDADGLGLFGQQSGVGSREDTEGRGPGSAHAPADSDSSRLGPDEHDVRQGQPDVAWGDYAPAIARWESILGRVAPAPTELSPRGSQRLSPAFVEFLMGLPPGWVTDVPGLSRNDQLKALGNGVVPQQGAAAIRYLLQFVPASILSDLGLHAEEAA